MVEEAPKKSKDESAGVDEVRTVSPLLSLNASNTSVEAEGTDQAASKGPGAPVATWLLSADVEAENPKGSSVPPNSVGVETVGAEAGAGAAVEKDSDAKSSAKELNVEVDDGVGVGAEKNKSWAED